MERIKNFVKSNKERIAIVALSSAVAVLAVNNTQVRKKWNVTSDFTRTVLANLEEGFLPSFDEDGISITFKEAVECHCPTEKPRAAKTKAAA